MLAYRYWKVRGLNPNDPASVKKAIELEKEFDRKFRCSKENDPADGHCLGDEYFKQVEAKVSHPSITDRPTPVGSSVCIPGGPSCVVWVV